MAAAIQCKCRAKYQKPLLLRRQAHEEGTGRTKHMSKNDEVKALCRCVTLLRHAVEERETDVLDEE